MRLQRRTQQPLGLTTSVARRDVDVGTPQAKRLLDGGRAQPRPVRRRCGLAAHVLCEAKATKPDDGEVVAEPLAATTGM